MKRGARIALPMMLLALLAGGRTALARSLTPVQVGLSARDNLQDLTFWIAVGAGYFTDEGVAVQPIFADTPSDLLDFMRQRRPPVAVLPGPAYLELIGEHYPLEVVANLLANDPTDLVVRRPVAERRRLDPTAPLLERLRRMRGLRVGVAPGPRSRLRALYHSVGLSADRWLKIVVLMGPEQNAALESGRVDAIYAHTPFLERALVLDHALLMVNQSSGEVPVLAGRPIHALVARSDFAADRANVVRRLTRALYRAEELVHADPKAATAALARAVPTADARVLGKVVELYGPAVPPSPRVSVAAIERELALYPASKRPPDLRGVDLAAYVAPQFAELAQVEESPPPSAKVKPAIALERALIGTGVLAAALLIMLRRARRRGQAASPEIAQRSRRS